MDLQLTGNIKKGVLAVSGPQVVFELADSGQANVLVHVALSDGTHINFPDGSGKATSRSTVLPPGDYDCTIMVAAFSHGAFGSSYDARVSVGGKKAATAQGSVASGASAEDDIESFLLRVS